MTVKKNSKAKKTKKPAKQEEKKISAQQRKEIKEAVDILPGLLFEHVQFSDEHTAPRADDIPPSHHILSETQRRDLGRKRTIIAIAVGVLMMILFGMWMVNIKTLVYDMTRNPGTEAALFTEAKNDFSSILESLREEDVQKEKALQKTEKEAQQRNEKVKKALKGALPAATVSSTTSGQIIIVTPSTTL